MNYINRLRGNQAKKNGDSFEMILRLNAVKQDFNIIQIPTGCRMVGPGKVFRVRTPFDFIFTKLKTLDRLHQRFVLFADAKTIKEKTFSSSRITPHQCQELLKLHNQKFMAGYIINFKLLNSTVFFNATQLDQCRKTLRSSLKPGDGLYLGTNANIILEKIFKID